VVQMRLTTCSFGEYRSEQGIPVRTSIGHPRFWRGEQLSLAPSLYPTRPMLVLPIDRYEQQYRQILDSIGFDKIRGELERLVRVKPDEPPTLVLMCFEKLSKPGAWCHRRMFAQWWLEHTGEEVPELGSMPAPPAAQLFD
jgi:hypothetical protein